MINLIPNKTEGQSGFIPLTAGEHTCPSSHSYGPYIRDHYIIHFCLSGKGTLYNSSGAHPVEGGELFIIREGEVTTYTADALDPWRYVWLGFVGERAAVFDTSPCVMKAPRELTARLREYVEEGECSSDIYISILYELTFRLFTSTDEYTDTLSAIRRYIKYQYMEGITAGGVSKLFGFERSYLYRIFKARYGVGIKEYLTRVRMEHARSHLNLGYSVSDVAAMVGYSDGFNFSKAYKKYYGVSPVKDKAPREAENVRWAKGRHS